MAGKRSWLRRLVYWVNVLFALALLCSYLAYFVPPTLLSVFAFAGLAYPILLLVNLGFVLFWLLKFDRRILLSVLCISIGYVHIQGLYQFSGSNKVVNPANKLKVMSFNVRMFNHYDWIPAPDVPQKIAKSIAAQKPHLLFLQEYYQTEKTPRLDYTHHYAKMTNKGRNYGLAIYSQYPIAGQGTIRYDENGARENNEFIFADIVAGGDTIRCINAHLASVGLDNKDYERLESPTEGSQEEIEQDILQILKRLHHAFVRRTAQVKALAAAIESSRYPVILAGDFNDTPSSYTYRTLNTLLQDSYLQSGQGFSRTYTKGWIPFRIDFVFHDHSFRAFNYRVLPAKLSDHYALYVELEL